MITSLDMTFVQFLQTWGIFSGVALVLFGYTERFLRFMPWFAMWLMLSPVRSPEQDVFWMGACYFLTEFMYRRALKQTGGISC